MTPVQQKYQQVIRDKLPQIEARKKEIRELQRKISRANSDIGRSERQIEQASDAVLRELEKEAGLLP